jgi:hypothetical protein
MNHDNDALWEQALSEPPAEIERGLNALRTALETRSMQPVITGLLRDLLHRGLTASDLEVHVERWRAVNDCTWASPLFERNALDALDLLSGWCSPGSAVTDPKLAPGPAEAVTRVTPGQHHDVHARRLPDRAQAQSALARGGIPVEDAGFVAGRYEFNVTLSSPEVPEILPCIREIFDEAMAETGPPQWSADLRRQVPGDSQARELERFRQSIAAIMINNDDRDPDDPEYPAPYVLDAADAVETLTSLVGWARTIGTGDENEGSWPRWDDNPAARAAFRKRYDEHVAALLALGYTRVQAEENASQVATLLAREDAYWTTPGKGSS